jgi:hypothetical protein
MADLQEQERLGAVYAAMADEELAQIFGESVDLTDVARASLTAEMARRGMVPGDVPGVSRQEAHDRPLVTVEYFYSVLAAELAKGILESSGIEAFLKDDNVSRIYMPVVVGGMALQVDPENVDAARELLEHPLPDSEIASEED